MELGGKETGQRMKGRKGRRKKNGEGKGEERREESRGRGGEEEEGKKRREGASGEGKERGKRGEGGEGQERRASCPYYNHSKTKKKNKQTKEGICCQQILRD